MSLSPDTQAILLLCGEFGDRGPVRPLTPKEYDQLAQALREAGSRPGQLLADGAPRLNGSAGVDPDRIARLLERGAALALAVERWKQRGIWIVGRGDDAYPARLKRRLGGAAPPLIYGIGPVEKLAEGGLAVVGSRDADPAAFRYSEELGAAAAREGITIISGGARGVDEAAMVGAVAAGGRAVGVLSDGLEAAALSAKHRSSLARGSLTLISTAGPAAHFSVGLAMGRNRYIYTLADAAVVVHSRRAGGTWTGAKECIGKGWVPVYVRELKDAHLGNAGLLDLRGEVRPLPAERFNGSVRSLLAESPRPTEAPAPTQMGLFGPFVAREPREPYDISSGSDAPPAAAADTGLVQSPPMAPERFYELFQQFMTRFAVEPRSAAVIARETGLVPSQVKQWLARGLDDGWLRKHGRPARYLLASVEPPPPRRKTPRVRKKKRA